MAPDEPEKHESAGDNTLDPIDELDIERALGQAAGLTDELELEIGSDSIPNSTSGGDVRSASANVESQLNEVEELLSNVSQGLESDNDDTPIDDAPTPDEAPPSTESSSKNPEQTDPQMSAEKGPSVEPALETDHPLEIEPHHTPSSDVTETRCGRLTYLFWSIRTRWNSSRESFTSIVTDGLHSSLTICIQTLDWIDGWFSWINLSTRRLLGWLALAVMVAACSIAAYSFYG